MIDKKKLTREQRLNLIFWRWVGIGEQVRTEAEGGFQYVPGGMSYFDEDFIMRRDFPVWRQKQQQ